jgi:hypothetical protein
MAIRQGNDVIFRIRTGTGAPVADHFVGGEGPFAGLPGEMRRPQESA